MKKFYLVLVVLFMILLITGCAAGVNELENVAADSGEVAGFWMGLWHGLIAPFVFIVSLFKDSIGIYELHNNGNWYNFGFVFGLMIIFGSGGRSSRKCRKQKKD
ncbi:MAG: hypothetical protein KAQ69_05700 [Spirochaetales bacterium]|nr:hypothetical protein [Spirochaetales bacterium]